METWETEEGEVLNICEMDTNHIENCIRFLEKKFKNGKVIVLRESGGGFDDLDMWYDCWEEDITEKVNSKLKVLKKELDKRFRVEAQMVL